MNESLNKKFKSFYSLDFENKHIFCKKNYNVSCLNLNN